MPESPIAIFRSDLPGATPTLEFAASLKLAASSYAPASAITDAGVCNVLRAISKQVAASL
jgi:hypothetical protein